MTKASDDMGLMTAETVSRILESTPPYTNDAQKDACERMVDELSEEEQEIAARTSFAYWVASENQTTHERPSEEIRKKMAMREARRHLVGEGSNYKKGLTALRSSCQYRKDRRLDVMRTLFLPSWSYSNEKDAKVAEQYRLCVEKDLKKQLMVVRGMDKDYRAVMIKFPRESGDSTDEAFVTAQLYIAERTIAATEFLSQGTQEKVVVVMEFGNYSSSNAPPLAALKTVVTLLQRNYPERLSHLMILDPPFWMRGLFALVHPFMSADTKEKLMMISDNKTKEEKIASLIMPQHAMSFMLPDGKLTSDVELDKFLLKVPFQETYDLAKPKEAVQVSMN